MTQPIQPPKRVQAILDLIRATIYDGYGNLTFDAMPCAGGWWVRVHVPDVEREPDEHDEREGHDS